MREHLNQELEHAMILAGQIDFLGGVPQTEIPPIRTELRPEAALGQDLSLEERQLQRYRERIEEAHALGLPDVAEALVPLLSETQSHVRDLRGVLGTRAPLHA
jgi:bacterioferritin